MHQFFEQAQDGQSTEIFAHFCIADTLQWILLMTVNVCVCVCVYNFKNK